MSEYGDPAAAKEHHDRSPISVLWVIAASLLCGVGIFFLWYWLWDLPSAAAWPWFSGVAFVFVGSLMFLNPRAGWDHA
jgi:hypothetical protein